MICVLTAAELRANIWLVKYIQEALVSLVVVHSKVINMLLLIDLLCFGLCLAM